jgi:hypothetical protein
MRGTRGTLAVRLTVWPAPNVLARERTRAAALSRDIHVVLPGVRALRALMQHLLLGFFTPLHS